MAELCVLSPDVFGFYLDSPYNTRKSVAAKR